MFEPIFEQTAEWMATKYASLPKLALSAGTKHVTAISVGTLYVTTCESSLWGTRQGTRVTLHLVGVAAAVTIGLLEDIFKYDVLTQEIIEAVVAPENADLVQDTVLPWFLRPSDKLEQAQGASTVSPHEELSELGSASAPSA